MYPCGCKVGTFQFNNISSFTDIKNWIGWYKVVRLKSPKLRTISNDGVEVQDNKTISITNQGLKFGFEFESLPSKTFPVNGYNYSMTQIRMNLTRTQESRRKIFGAYHGSTFVFAAISLISYFIPPDVVPGRMGMLITLYLILINSYNSVDAPQSRSSFSAIEMW